LEGNLRRYRRYIVFSDFLSWLPIFFLYFSSHLSLREVLWLEALYYLCGVAMEVPSGYFSDRFGRRPTLILAALFFVFSYLCFLAGSGFVLFALGQVFLASALAFRSGSDTAFHFDSLSALGRGDEYEGREASLARLGLVTLAVASLAGGFVGSFDLRWAYALALVGGLSALVVAFGFVEPGDTEEHRSGCAPDSFLSQLARCIGYWRLPALLWLLCYEILLYFLAHIPYEFYQGYLKLLHQDFPLFQDNTPLYSGLLMASTFLLGAWAAGRSAAWRQKFGLSRLLLGAAALQWLVILLLGALLHPLLVLIILARNLPMSAVEAPFRAAVMPRIAVAQRATYFSLQSMVGRLFFSAMLFSLSFLGAAEGGLSWPDLQRILLTAAGFGAIGLILLFLARDWLQRTAEGSLPDSRIGESSSGLGE
jgi:hypothetical protein